MRFLVVADIHSNLEALNAVVNDAPVHDRVLVLGDLVGYGPSPNEVCDMLLDAANTTVICGNHDLAGIGKLDTSTFNEQAKAAAEWTNEALTAENRKRLGALDPFLKYSDEVYLAHGSPRDPVWEYATDPSTAALSFPLFDGIALVGHSHIPLVFEADGNQIKTAGPMKHGERLSVARSMINPGSVGQPRDGNPKAAYGILDTREKTFEWRRTAYNFYGTQEKIKKAGLPAVCWQRLAMGR